MLSYFVNIEDDCDNSNYELKNYYSAGAVGKAKADVQQCEDKQREHGYGGRVQGKAIGKLPLQEANEAALHATTGTVYMQQCPGWASEHMCL